MYLCSLLINKSFFIMANVSYRLSTKPKVIKDGIQRYEVLARLHVRQLDLYAKTGIRIPKELTDRSGNKKVFFTDGRITIPKLSLTDDVQVAIQKELSEAKAALAELDDRIREAYSQATAEGRPMGRTWLQDVIDGTATSSGDENRSDGTLLAVFSGFIESEPMKKLSMQCLNHYKVMWSILARYEVMKGVVLTLDTITPDQLRSIEKYAREEHKLFDDEKKREKPLQRKAMEASGNGRYPKPRGDNGIVVLFKKFRAFMRWANGLDKDYLIEPLTHNNPFDRFPLKSERYGTPFYLTVEERDRLAKAELPPRLARQRDIFIFHSFIGCRVSDLWAMTKKNVVDGNFIEYIPRKTADGRPVTVRVPLTKSAKEILERYKDCPGGKLLPFVAQQQYNEDIKEMLRLAKIDRIVTVLNSLTGEEEKKPIYEAASSHLARRNFIGNMYRKVKDPNAIGKLSGHAEGSKAFARYRDIDDDMAKELVSFLESTTDQENDQASDQVTTPTEAQ